MTSLPDSARRVQAAADALGLTIEVAQFDVSSRTAGDAAAACGCELNDIVKSLVFQGAESGRAFLLLVAGGNRVDETIAAGVLGEPIERPSAKRVRALTGYAIGGIPPFGHSEPLPVWIDEELLKRQRVWAAAGTPQCVFSIDPRDLAAAISAKPARLG